MLADFFTNSYGIVAAIVLGVLGVSGIILAILDAIDDCKKPIK